MNEDRLKHIDKTKKYWYAYAESHYPLNNYTNANTKKETERKADIDKTDLEHIDKTKKCWYAYAESHYSTKSSLSSSDRLDLSK